MSIDPLTSLSSIRAELESGWALFDAIWKPFGPADWTRKFGKTWTYAEEPYHLAYFDGTLAKYLALGANAPDGRLHMKTFGDINAWNARELAARGPGHTIDDTLAAMHKARNEIRTQLNSMLEADLEAKAWMPLIFGWVTKRDLLQAIIVHNVAEYWKLWIRTGKLAPAPSPSAVNFRLAFMMKLMPATLNRELAQQPFTMTWNFSGPGGGSWTFAVAKGECKVTNAAAPQPDLSISIAPEDFHRMVAKMTPPPLLMLTGKMKVKGFMKMGRFGKLFPEPRPDQELTGAAMG
jgi:putative sterol carrier protein